MYYNYYQSVKTEGDECVSKGICSINPLLSSLQEVILLHLKELAFYLVKLQEWGVGNERIKEHVLESLSGIVINAEYNQDQLHSVIGRLHDDIFQAKEIYKQMAQNQETEANFLKTYFKHKQPKHFSLAEAIKKGEKYFLKKADIFTQDQKELFDIMLLLVKSMCVKMAELKSFDQNFDEGYYAILSMLNKMNFQEATTEELKTEIEKFIGVYYEIVKKVFYTQIENYGEPEQVEVSFSTRPGRAILISGSDLKELEELLKATQDKDIDIYTHGIEMLMAHTYPKLRAYPNLRGHFTTGGDSSLLDFATFPGAILMTRHSLQKVEYLYQGRLFTSDLIAPRGVVKIQEKDFTPLINSTLHSEGFSKGKQKPPMLVGYSEDEVMNKLNPVFEKMMRGDIKHLYIIGLLNEGETHRQYFDEFIKLIPKDCYALSLAYDKSADNIFHLPSYYEYSLVYRVLKKIGEIKPLREFNISIFLTKCDKHTISNVLNLQHMGIKNIYMCKCSPVLVNPALISAIKNTFGIEEFFTPKADISKTLNL